MTDIFFSYSSKDRERVRPVREALVTQGFDVFWDQTVPTGLDRDTWIRQHLNRAKCVLVFWSGNSVASDNVRHEAMVAKQHGKLVPVILDPLRAQQFPMGLYAAEGANLGSWDGDAADTSWINLQHEIEAKLTPLWVRRITDALEAELVAERARREAAKHNDRVLREQIATEEQAQQELRRELDQALDEVAALKQRLDEAEQLRTALEARVSVLSQQLAQSEGGGTRPQPEGDQASNAAAQPPGFQARAVAESPTRQPRGQRAPRTLAILFGAMLLSFLIGFIVLSWHR